MINEIQYTNVIGTRTNGHKRTNEWNEIKIVNGYEGDGFDLHFSF